MLASALLTTASLLGLCAALSLRAALGAWARLAVGVALGQLLVLWFPFGLALCFDLGARSAGVLALWLLTLASGVSTLRLMRRAPALLGSWHLQLKAELNQPAGKLTAALTVLLLTLLGVVHHTHYLLPQRDGLHSAGVTWGDLPLHLALATRALYAEGLPPLEHPLFLHGPLAYPFLPDYAVAVLCALGLPLRWAFIVGGMLPLATLPALLYGITRLWLPDAGRPAALLAVGLFFFAGGFGFAFVLHELLRSPAPWTVLASMNATYIDPWVLKSSQVGNLFVAARSAAYGMPLGACALLLLGHARERPPAAGQLWLLGAAAIGALPLIHGHSFLVAGGTLLAYGLASMRTQPRHVLAALAVWLLLSLPQLGWLRAQHAASALRLTFGMLRAPTGLAGWLRDLTLDLGVWLFLLPIAWLTVPLRARRLVLPLLMLLPLSNVVCFTPAHYDNVKLLAWFDLGASPLVAALLVRLAASTGAGGRLCAALLAIGCTLSGLLAVAHELTNDARVIGYQELAFAEFVRKHTRPSDVVATAAAYHDPVAMFSGRRVPLATPAMLATHGIDVRKRARDVVMFYRGGPAAAQARRRLGIDAAVVGARERRDLPWLDETALRAEASAVLEHDGGRLYLLRLLR